jgi:myo-inositol 2-dehydrogenase / D-chiro-inositol 1-dehydrogenase
MALIDRGVPFFVEKPLAVNLQPAEDIGQRIGGLVTAVGYKFRALDTLPRIRSLLDETPPKMVLGAWHDATPAPAWWSQPQRSGGQIVEQATHLVDLARLLLGEGSVLSASAGAAVSAAHLRFGDVPAVFTATCLLQGRQAIHVQLICEGRVITITEQQVLIETGRQVDSFATTVDPIAVEDLAFLDAVRERDPHAVLSSYADALKTHRLCIAIRDGVGLLH